MFANFVWAFFYINLTGRRRNASTPEAHYRFLIDGFLCPFFLVFILMTAWKAAAITLLVRLILLFPLYVFFVEETD